MARSKNLTSRIRSTKPRKLEPAVTFRENTKRRRAYDALMRKDGCSLVEAAEFLKWSLPVCGSEFREVARLTKLKLVRTDDAYRLGAA